MKIFTDPFLLHLVLASLGGLGMGAVLAIGTSVNFRIQNKYWLNSTWQRKLVVLAIAGISYVISGLAIIGIALKTVLRPDVTLFEAFLFAISAAIVFILAVHFGIIPPRIDKP
jgi:hypothetical protein